MTKSKAPITCPLALQAWCKEQGFVQPDLPDSQRAKLYTRHTRYANRLLRCLNRVTEKKDMEDTLSESDYELA